MNIQPTQTIMPIVVPQRNYTDKDNQHNAWFENNLALFIQPDGLMTILIRQVNYRKFCNDAFIMGHDNSRSLYSMLTGYNFNDLKYNDIEYDWGDFPESDSYWRGMDDIRFVSQNYLLVTCSERNHGKPCLFLGHLHDNVIKLVQKLEPSVLEKNWMPFHDNQMQVIYKVSPFTVKSLVCDNLTPVAIDATIQKQLEGYHGSTNGVPFKGGFLFLVHKCKYPNKPEHRWLLYYPHTQSVRISPPFQFFQHSFLEFNCSLVDYQNTLYVTLAVNEDKLYVMTISYDMIKL